MNNHYTTFVFDLDHCPQEYTNLINILAQSCSDITNELNKSKLMDGFNPLFKDDHHCFHFKCFLKRKIVPILIGGMMMIR